MKILVVFIAFNCLISFCMGQMNISKLCPNDTTGGGLFPSELDSVIKPHTYNYHYDCRLQYIANLKIGFMDTFSLANERFRYRISPDTSKDCIIEKFENGEWKENIAVEHSRFTDIMLEDVNNDGYVDFIVKYQWWEYAYPFNPRKKIFEEKTSFELQYDRKLIDVHRNIYCDNVDIHGEVCSHLYTFKGLNQKILYTLYFKELKDKNGYNTHVFNAIELYKGEYEEYRKDLKPILIKRTKVHIDDCDSDYKFNYVRYWKRRYKKLLNLN